MKKNITQNQTENFGTSNIKYINYIIELEDNGKLIINKPKKYKITKTKKIFSNTD